MFRPTVQIFTMAVAIVAFVFPAAGQERREVPEFRVYGQPAPGDGNTVRAFIDAYLDAWGREDVDGLMTLHTDDTEWINAYARMFQGAEALGDFLEHKLFPEFDPAVSKQEAANMAPISIRYLGEDAAVVHLYTDGRRGASRNPGEAIRRTHIHLVLEQRDDTVWRVAHTVIMDAR